MAGTMYEVTSANGRQTVPVILDHRGQPIPSDRGLPLPQIITESSIMYGGSATYWHGVWDEAIRQGRENSLAMARDEHLQRCLWERIRKVTSLKFHLEIDDEDDPWQIAVRDGITQSLNQAHRLRRYLRNHMFALWSGRAGNQVQWQWMGAKVDGPRGSEEHRVLKLADHLPINGDKIGYTLNLIPYLQVYGTADNADIPGAEFVQTTESRAMLITGTWRERVLLHNFNVIDADFWDPERAGAIGGVGLRSYLFWSWWMRQEYITSVLKSLDRFGLGFVVIEYESGNDTARGEALKAGNSLSTNRSVLLVPVKGGRSGTSGAVRVVETPVSGAQIMLQLQQACEEREEKFILGQTASSSSQTSGMGTHDPIAQMENQFAILEEDAQELGETTTGSDKEPGLISVIKRHSYPWADFPVRFVMDCRPPDVEKKLASVTMGWNVGVDYVKDEIRALTGMSKPGPGDEVISNPALQQQPGADGQPQVGPDGQPLPPQPGQPGDGGQQEGGDGQPPQGPPEPPPEGGDPVFAQLMAQGGQGGAAKYARDSDVSPSQPTPAVKPPSPTASGMPTPKPPTAMPPVVQRPPLPKADTAAPHTKDYTQQPGKPAPGASVGDLAVKQMGKEPAAEKGKEPHEMTRAEFFHSKMDKPQMIAAGADGHLSSAVRTHIPVSKIVGREPTPAMEGGYKKGTPITQPVEVVYNPEEDNYTLYAGNHRVTQAELNGQTTIPAFVQGLTTHKRAVKSALAAGKPVPPEVLADYPDLAPLPHFGGNTPSMRPVQRPGEPPTQYARDSTNPTPAPAQSQAATTPKVAVATPAKPTGPMVAGVKPAVSPALVSAAQPAKPPPTPTVQPALPAVKIAHSNPEHTGYSGQPGDTELELTAAGKRIGHVAIGGKATGVAQRMFPADMPEGSEAYRITGIKVDDAHQGRGHGRNLYLAGYASHPDGSRFYNSNTEPGAVGALDSLARDGLIELRRKGALHLAWLTPEGRKQGRELLGLPPEQQRPMEDATAATVQRIQGNPTEEHRFRADRWAKESQGLSPEMATDYSDHLAHALSVLPGGISQHVNKHIDTKHGGVNFYQDLKSLRDHAERLTGKSASKVVGFAEDTGEHTTLHLDGGDDPRGTYVHELWHAADNNNVLSEDKGWQSAYKSDIINGKHLLSRYALINASEGFAEFGRALAERGESYMAERFPKAVKHLKAKGLI